MTILPKKKPENDGQESTSGEHSHPHRVPHTHGHSSHPHPHGNVPEARVTVRPRSSPPRWGAGGASAREERFSSDEDAPEYGAHSHSGHANKRRHRCSGSPLRGSRKRGGLSVGGHTAHPVGSPQARPVENTGGEEQPDAAPVYNSEDEYENSQDVDDKTLMEMEARFEHALKEKKGWTIRQMGVDGACLFRAVADQVYGDQEMHSIVRNHCMDYMLKNYDYFSQYVTEDFMTYINRKRSDHCHGNHLEMVAMSEMYNRPIEVYQYSTEPCNTFHGMHVTDNEPIRVSYHMKRHYNSIVNPWKATIGVGLGLPAFKPGLADKQQVDDAIKASEESELQQTMLEDKMRYTDWEATNEAIEEHVARESYLDWLREQEKRARQATAPRSASATCSSAEAAASRPRGGRSPRNHSTNNSPANTPERPESSEHHGPPSPRAAGTSGDPHVHTTVDRIGSPVVQGPSTKSPSPLPMGAEGGASPVAGVSGTLEDIPPAAYGLTDWDDDDLLANVLAISQQEYLDSLKRTVAVNNPEQQQQQQQHMDTLPSFSMQHSDAKGSS
ncbi:OTU domain-containing protein 5-B-like [Branchiostoma floridae]|uniref:ubiquitinyl hydrolase 1 n=1 Tax=Branchiostoma floridae TaxID=7739 RepID=A0A9J7L5J4_BRAFL|nr:OTU domain-containing protein 5-B-like [Branchiostoma floridae]